MRAHIFVWLVLASMLLGCDSSSEHIALGALERDRVIHPATANEVLTELYVQAGERVQQGQLLAQLDSTYTQALVNKAHAGVAQAQANLTKLQNGARSEEVASARAKVSAAQAAFKESQANYQRAKQLVVNNLASKETRDRALATRDESSANLESAQQYLNELVNGARVEDIDMAKAELEAAKAELAAQQKTLDDLSIRATREGIVDNITWNVGERVTLGSPVAIILSAGAPYARVYIPEPYRAQLQTGMALTIRVDGIDAPYQGTLRWIANEPAFTPYYALNQEERARLMYLAEVQLPEKATILASGIPAQVVMP